MSDGKQWLFGDKFGLPTVVVLIVVGAIIFAIPVFVIGLVRVGWGVAAPLLGRRRPIVFEKINRTAETVERFVGPQTKQR